jgi:2-oxo-hept-3-ene-1,7-dioate hydratase
MTADEIAAAAQELEAADNSRRLMGALTLRHPEMTMDDAYRVQQAWVMMKLAGGRTLIGHKIGLTSKAMQQAVNIDTPDSGSLLDDMLYPDGGRIPTARFIAPRVEVELAFVLKSTLSGPACTLLDVMRATEFVIPALEILDSRMHRIDPVTKVSRKVQDTIADNAANAGLVLGSRPFDPKGVDLRWIAALLYRDGEIEETGVAAGVLNNPATSIAWLANRLHGHGESLRPGQVILSGSFTRPIEARAGQTIFADFGPFGSVGCHFC